jgi:hypothetical protein
MLRQIFRGKSVINKRETKTGMVKYAST